MDLLIVYTPIDAQSLPAVCYSSLFIVAVTDFCGVFWQEWIAVAHIFLIVCYRLCETIWNSRISVPLFPAQPGTPMSTRHLFTDLLEVVSWKWSVKVGNQSSHLLFWATDWLHAAPFLRSPYKWLIRRQLFLHPLLHWVDFVTWIALLFLLCFFWLSFTDSIGTMNFFLFGIIDPQYQEGQQFYRFVRITVKAPVSWSLGCAHHRFSCANRLVCRPPLSRLPRHHASIQTPNVSVVALFRIIPYIRFISNVC